MTLRALKYFGNLVLICPAALAMAGSLAAGSFQEDLVNAALERTLHQVRYDGRYRKIAYPMGDVPDTVGVCTDLVIRAYRAVGIDLQKRVHEDMRSDFRAYPDLWGLSRPDSNIDHRRVPNLQRFFERHGTIRPRSLVATDYEPGDLVTWMLPGNLPHIGMVTDKAAPVTGRPLIVHNIGAGPTLEDMLFDYPITGHFRFGDAEPRADPMVTGLPATND